MKNIKSIGIVFLTLISFATRAQSNSTWELAKSKYGTEISYKWVTSSDGKKARKMKTSFVLEASDSLIISQIKDSSLLKKWSKTIDSCSTTSLSPRQWKTYTRYKLPWPIKSKDLVTESQWTKTATESYLKTTSAPSAIPTSKNSNRIQSYIEEW